MTVLKNTLCYNIYRSGWPAAVILWGIAFSLSCLSELHGITKDTSAPSVFDTILGNGKLALSWNMIQRADVYFHRGAKHAPETLLKKDHPLLRMTKAITPPHGHYHRSGQQVQEIIPWLWLSVRADPQNTSGWLIAAFWIANELNRPDIAFKLLAEARSYNPSAYELYLDEGRLAIHFLMLQHAARMLDRGLQLCKVLQDHEDTDIVTARAMMLQLRSLVHEANGETAAAIECLQDVQRLLPDKHGINDRIAELRSGTHTVKGKELQERLEKMNVASSQMNILHLNCEQCDHDEHDEHMHNH